MGNAWGDMYEENYSSRLTPGVQEEGSGQGLSLLAGCWFHLLFGGSSFTSRAVEPSHKGLWLIHTLLLM